MVGLQRDTGFLEGSASRVKRKVEAAFYPVGIKADKADNLSPEKKVQSE